MSPNNKHSTLRIFSPFLILLLHFFSPSLANFPWFWPPSLANIPTGRDGICDLMTPFPHVCKSTIPNNFANIHDCGRFSTQRSLSNSFNLLNLINSHLASPNALSPLTVRALQDCQSLMGQNQYFLSTIIHNIASTNTLSISMAVDTHTMLSAVLTNQQTCLDGFGLSSDWSLISALSAALTDGNMLNSVSLALFWHGWVPKWWQWQANPTVSDCKLDRIYGLVSTGRSPLHLTSGNVNVSQMVTVRQDGTGNYTTIGAAIAAMPNNTTPNSSYYLIYVVAGVYQEYISIPYNKQYLIIMGDGINKTVITGNHGNGNGWTTFSSATFAVVSPGFVMMGITIQNTAGGANFGSVALQSSADMGTFYKCSFEGYQDTLLAHSFRQFYRQCDIYGTIDFIFGNAAVVLQDCNIYLRLPLPGQFNTISAQGKSDINQNTGTSIHNCSITATPELASSNRTIQTYLGRPWQPYATTVYMQSFLDSLINPAGWSVWDGTQNLNTSFYAVYDNRGPGSVTSSYVPWSYVINATVAAKFTVSNFTQGDSWLPATGVCYTGGLM